MLDLYFFFFMIISVQSSEAVIPVCLINPITLDYLQSPGIKNSAQIWLVIWSLIKKRLFSLLLFYEWDINKTLIMQHALMHKQLQRLTHTNIHISPEEEGPRGPHGAICVENRQNTQKGRKMSHLSRTRTSRWRIVDAATDRKWSQHPDDRQVGVSDLALSARK